MWSLYFLLHETANLVLFICAILPYLLLTNVGFSAAFSLSDSYNSLILHPQDVIPAGDFFCMYIRRIGNNFGIAPPEQRDGTQRENVYRYSINPIEACPALYAQIPGPHRLCSRDKHKDFLS